MTCRTPGRNTRVVHRCAGSEGRRGRRRPPVASSTLRRGDGNMVGRLGHGCPAVMAASRRAGSRRGDHRRESAVIRGRYTSERRQRCVAGIARARRRHMHRRFAHHADISPGMTSPTGAAADGNTRMRIWCRRPKCHCVMTALASRRRRTVRKVIGRFSDHRHPKVGAARGVARRAPSCNAGVAHRCARSESRRRRRRPPGVTGPALGCGHRNMIRRLADRRPPIMAVRSRAGGRRRDRRRESAVIGRRYPGKRGQGSMAGVA